MCNVYICIFFRATWGAVGHGALYHSQVQFLVYLSQSLLGEVLVKLLTLLFDRVLSRTLHTHRVSRLPFHGVLQRPRACFFLVSGIHCMYNDAVSSQFDDDILLKKKFNTYYPPPGTRTPVFSLSPRSCTGPTILLFLILLRFFSLKTIAYYILFY